MFPEKKRRRQTTPSSTNVSAHFLLPYYLSLPITNKRKRKSSGIILFYHLCLTESGQTREIFLCTYYIKEKSFPIYKGNSNTNICLNTFLTHWYLWKKNKKLTLLYKHFEYSYWSLLFQGNFTLQYRETIVYNLYISELQKIKLRQFIVLFQNNVKIHARYKVKIVTKFSCTTCQYAEQLL